MDDASPTTGIVFYSRTGHSARLAKRLCDASNGTLVEIFGTRYAGGLMGIARALVDSLRQKGGLTEQAFPKVSQYDRIVLCGPIWTSYPAVPLRDFMRAGLEMPRTVGLFLTCSSHASAEKAFAVAEADLGRSLATTRYLTNAAENTDEESRAIEAFLSELKTGSSPERAT